MCSVYMRQGEPFAQYTQRVHEDKEQAVGTYGIKNLVQEKNYRSDK